MDKQQLLTDALDVGEGLLTRGAEVGRVEDTITRILKSGGADRVDVVTCRFGDQTLTQTRRVREAVYNMTALTELNSLSREICAGGMTHRDIAAKLQAIATAPACSFHRSILFYALTSFVFSLFFGGSLLDAVLSGAIGVFVSCSTLFGVWRYLVLLSPYCAPLWAALLPTVSWAWGSPALPTKSPSGTLCFWSQVWA